MIGNKKTDEGLDLLAKIHPYLDNILHNDSYNRLKNRIQNDKELTMLDIMGDAYNAIAMDNREAIYGIVSVVTGKEPKDVAKQPLEETLTVFQDVMGSSVISFFTFCARMAVRL